MLLMNSIVSLTLRAQTHAPNEMLGLKAMHIFMHVYCTMRVVFSRFIFSNPFAARKHEENLYYLCEILA